jgi:urease accessory protein
MRTAMRIAVFAALCACAAPARAHVPAMTLGDFYAGLLHPLTSLEHVLAFVGFALLAGQQGARAQASVLVFPAALLAGTALGVSAPPFAAIDLANLASVVLFGLLVAMAISLPVPVVCTLAALGGLVHGYANGVALASSMTPWLYVPGVAFAGLVVATYGFVILDFIGRRNSAWMPVAVRVAGSWIAAIGILVLGLGARPLLSA